MTALGIILMVVSLVAWVWLENVKLERPGRAAARRGRPARAAFPTAPGPGFAEPPLAGPSTDPGP